MNNIDNKKQKLEQKKARLQLEENKLRITERKQRTRNLIELGGLIVKSNLDSLPINALYGALLSIKETLNSDETILNGWIKKGKDAFNQETKEKTAVILKLETKQEEKIRTHIRQNGLRWNHLRQEWFGYTTNIETLKEGLGNIKYILEIIKE